MEEYSEESFTIEDLKAAYREAGNGPELVESARTQGRLESRTKLKYPEDSNFCNFESPVDNSENVSPLQPSPELRKQKRKKDPTKWNIEVQKKKRLMGETYLGYKKVETDLSVKPILCEKKPARELKPTCTSSTCRSSKERKCEQFSEADRKQLFTQYWSSLDWQQKRVYVLSSVEKVPTKVMTSKQDVSRRTETLFYYLERNGQKLRVCQTMFLNTLAVGQNQVFRWVKGNRVSRKESENSMKPEKEASRWARAFLDELPKMESHYCRRETSKMYLEPIFESKAKLFRVYQDFCTTNNHPTVARNKFHSIVNDMNIGVFLPKKDKCDTCCGFEVGSIPYQEWKEHVTNKDEARKAKEKDKQNAIGGLCHALVVDVQAVKLSPLLNASAMYYKTKLMVHNYSIFDLSTRDVRCYWWNETEGELVASVFATFLIKYLDEKYTDDLPIIIWSDGCTNQNRNKILSNALLDYSEKSGKVIMQKYLEKGHTQMEVDSVHSSIERSLKGKAIHHPMDYVEITREARKSGHPYEAIYTEYSMILDYSRQLYMKYSDIRPGSKTGDPCVTDIRELQYDPSGTIKFKLDHSSEWALLPKKSRNVKTSEFPKLYKQRLQISKRKYKDLQELLPVIPKKYHDFYKNLPN